MKMLRLMISIVWGDFLKGVQLQRTILEQRDFSQENVALT